MARFLVIAAVLCALAADAATFTVTNTASSGSGSLRQAILDANAAAGHDTIDFSIGTGSQTIPFAGILDVTSPVTIDGSTQEGTATHPPITILGGFRFRAGSSGSIVRNLGVREAPAASGIVLEAGNITVAGTVITNNGFDGIEIRSAGNTIGGSTAADRNVIAANNVAGIRVLGNHNRIAGNWLGIDAAGTSALLNLGFEMYLLNASGNLIERNVVPGIFVDDSPSNRFEGNYLGIGPNGTASPVPFGGTGISIEGTGAGNVIGGDTAAARNVIANNDVGVALHAAGTIVRGNYIGTDPTGTTVIPNAIGIITSGGATIEHNLISGNSDIGISLSRGGLGTGGLTAENVITGNGGPGVFIDDVTGHSIRRNSIAANAGRGIEHNSGVFGSPAAPELTAALRTPAGVVVTGFIQSPPGPLELEFFASTAADPSGFGEGERYLAMRVVTTTSSDVQPFLVTIPAVAAGEFITATVTNAQGTTSTFSNALAASTDPVNLTIAKTAAPEVVAPGGTLVFTLTITNSGATLATGVVVTDPLPAGVTYAGSTTTRGTTSFSAGTVTATIGILAPGEAATVQITVHAASAGEITNSAAVAADQPDSVAADNSDSVAVVLAAAAAIPAASEFGLIALTLLLAFLAAYRVR